MEHMILHLRGDASQEAQLAIDRPAKGPQIHSLSSLPHASPSTSMTISEGTIRATECRHLPPRNLQLGCRAIVGGASFRRHCLSGEVRCGPRRRKCHHDLHRFGQRRYRHLHTHTHSRRWWSDSNSPNHLTIAPPPSCTVGVSYPASSSSLIVSAGSSASAVVSCSSPQGVFNAPSSLTLTGAPTGVTAKTTATTMDPGGSVTVQVTTVSTMSTSAFNLSLKLTSGSFTKTVPIAVTVNANRFSLTAEGAVGLIKAATTGQVTVNTAHVGVFNSDLSLSWVLPAGVTATFSSPCPPLGTAPSSLRLPSLLPPSPVRILQPCRLREVASHRVFRSASRLAQNSLLRPHSRYLQPQTVHVVARHNIERLPILSAPVQISGALGYINRPDVFQCR